MYLKVSVEGLVFGVDRLGCEVLGLDINAKVQCACMLNAISWCHIQAGYTSVQLALEQKHEATVEVLLEAIVAAGMDIDARYESRREQGQTLLMRASALGLTSTAAKLLALGADIAAKDAAGNTVVELAQNAQTIDLLKGAGATMPEFPEEKKNDLLIEYSKKGLAGGALMALQAGADVNHKGEESRTALHWAASRGHEALAQG